MRQTITQHRRSPVLNLLDLGDMEAIPLSFSRVGTTSAGDPKYRPTALVEAGHGNVKRCYVNVGGVLIFDPTSFLFDDVEAASDLPDEITVSIAVPKVAPAKASSGGIERIDEAAVWIATAPGEGSFKLTAPDETAARAMLRDHLGVGRLPAGTTVERSAN